jgi:hypothetical protein
MKIIRKLVELEASSSIMPLGILLITLTHSMFEFPLFQAYILFPILTLLSIVIKTQYSLPARGFKFILILFLPLTLWQIYSNSNCYLLLTQLKKSPHYIENNYIGNQMDKYFQINRSIFWDDYADMDLSRNIMYDLRVKENQKYFDFLYTTLVRVNNYMPSPASEIKLAILDEISGNTTMAEQRIELVRTAYPNSNKIFEQYIKQLTPNNIVAQAKLIALFK